MYWKWVQVRGIHVKVLEFYGTRMGSRCTLEVRAVVSEGCTIGSECHIGPYCIVPPGMDLEDGSDVYAMDGRIVIRKVGIKERGPGASNLHGRHVEYLKDASRIPCIHF